MSYAYWVGINMLNRMPKLVCMWKCPASLWRVPRACYWGQGLWRWRLCRRIVCMPCLYILANQQLYVSTPVFWQPCFWEHLYWQSIPVHLAHCALECAAPYVWIRENVHWLYTASCSPSWYRFQRPVMGSHADAIRSDTYGNIRAAFSGCVACRIVVVPHGWCAAIY